MRDYQCTCSAQEKDQNRVRGMKLMIERQTRAVIAAATAPSEETARQRADAEVMPPPTSTPAATTPAPTATTSLSSAEQVPSQAHPSNVCFLAESWGYVVYISQPPAKPCTCIFPDLTLNVAFLTIVWLKVCSWMKPLGACSNVICQSNRKITERLRSQSSAIAYVAASCRAEKEKSMVLVQAAAAASTAAGGDREVQLPAQPKARGRVKKKVSWGKGADDVAVSSADHSAAEAGSRDASLEERLAEGEQAMGERFTWRVGCSKEHTHTHINCPK